MKSSFYIVLILLGVFELLTAENDLSEKEEMRLEHKFTLIAKIGLSHADHCINPLNPDQRTLLENEIEVFGGCLNNTIDALFDKLDDDIRQADFQDPTKARKYLPQMCAVFNSGLKCTQDFAPALQLCTTEKQKLILAYILNITPIISEAACMENGSHLVQLLEHNDGMRCIGEVYNWLISNGRGLFTDPNNLVLNCAPYKNVQTDAVARFNECSAEALNLARPIIGKFCQATKCQEKTNDIICNQ